MGQNEELVWQKTIGGSGDDKLSDVVIDASGYVYSIGSIQDNKGYESLDIFVSKETVGGQQLWSRKIGESGNDIGISLLINTDGNVVLLTSSNSSSGIFSSNLGKEDIYLITLNSATGSLLNHLHFGGDSYDIPSSFIQNSTGNYVVYSHTRSETLDTEEIYGQFDLWVFETTVSGEVVWQRNYGGSDEDYSVDIIEHSNGEYILLGNSVSYDHDLTGLNYGDFDIVLLTIDYTGNLIDKSNYGGLAADYGAGLIELNNGNLVITGNTFSTGIDIGQNAGFSDAWTFELNSTNNIIWEETFGGEGSEYTSTITQDFAGNIVIAGTTNSKNIKGNVVEGKQNVWLTTISNEHTFESIHIIGGAQFDEVADIVFTNTDEFILAGATNATSSIVHELNGRTDGWLTKLRYNNNPSASLDISAYPNPSNDLFYINGLDIDDQISIVSNQGKLVQSDLPSNGFSKILDLNNFPSGVYYMEIVRGKEVQQLKLVKL
ncbi:MAG: T9SS type A sorting domain-containing protein [Crocinitomicaceae bacterium]|nr:T9SS type A sorting domain-containing protein [Crocinitomicaceae bacterium]